MASSVAFLATSRAVDVKPERSRFRVGTALLRRYEVALTRPTIRNRHLRASGDAPTRDPCLLAMERDCQAGNDEGQEEDRQDALSAASEGDGFALGGVEGLGSAGVSAVADLQGVTSGFDWYVDGLVQFHGPGRLFVDHRVVCAAADLRSDCLVPQSSALLPLFISSCSRRALSVVSGARRGRRLAATVIHVCR